MAKQVEDVTDARERVSKGKIPKGIIYVAAGIAAVLIGTLAFYYQSKTDAEVKEASEEQRAEKMKSRVRRRRTSASRSVPSSRPPRMRRPAKRPLR